MPVFRHDTVIELARGFRAFLKLEAGVARGSGAKEIYAPPGESAELKELRRRLGAKEKENALLRGELSAKPGIRPESIVWVFGTARTGSTWFTSMLGDLSGNAQWSEPLVRDLFGVPYYFRNAPHAEKRPEDFILGNDRREGWLASMRRFILDEAANRYPNLGGHLFIKEPNGTMGAPLIMEAMPESTEILLVRDPRDVVASLLDGNMHSGWLAKWKNGEEGPPDGFDPDEFARARTRDLGFVLDKGKQAYEAHKGSKSIVRYEDLREDAAKTIRHTLSELEIPFDEAELSRVVERHDWENIPEEKKGAGKFNRKAEPGGWREDLTPEQAGIVEDALGPFIKEHYPS
ncbi:MAG: sulfotransferase domain-containing protein [Actinomycetota bacterium]|jgi:hypothetical protein|nr:sulfotransferase domain-containing protein [Actinomycetota bacterium]